MLVTRPGREISRQVGGQTDTEWCRQYLSYSPPPPALIRERERAGGESGERVEGLESQQSGYTGRVFSRS